MHYNTTNEKGAQLLQFKEKAVKQEELILEYFEAFPGCGFTPSEVWRGFGNSKFAVPLTSIRRAITVLTMLGKLEKTTEKRMGIYGHPEHCWRLAKKGKEILPKYKGAYDGDECERCEGRGLVTITIHTDNGEYDADDQPCPECNP